MSSPTSQTPPPPMPGQQPATVAPEAAGPGLSEPQRLVDVFIAPSKTFDDIRRNAKWWAPFLLLVLSGTAYLFTIDKKIGWDAIVEARMAHATPFLQHALEQLPPEQKQNIVDRQIKGASRAIYWAPLVVLIYGLLAAGVLTPTFNFMFDAGVKFKHALAVVFYGALPRIVWHLLAMVVIFAGAEAEGFDQENPVATNLGAFLGINSDNHFLYRFLSAFDILFIWIVVVIAIGFTRISSRKKLSKGAAIAAVGGWYMVAMLVRAVLSQFLG
jgi:hypothetical protein